MYGKGPKFFHDIPTIDKNESNDEERLFFAATDLAVKKGHLEAIIFDDLEYKQEAYEPEKLKMEKTGNHFLSVSDTI